MGSLEECGDSAHRAAPEEDTEHFSLLMQPHEDHLDLLLFEVPEGNLLPFGVSATSKVETKEGIAQRQQVFDECKCLQA